jgi:hypothetical protein
MKPRKTPRTKQDNPKLKPEEASAFQQVQPEGFKDNPKSAIEAADMDVQDTIGGE